MSLPIPLQKNKPLRVILQLLFVAAVGGYVASLLIERGMPAPQDRAMWTQRDGFSAVSVSALSRDETGSHLSRQAFQALLADLREAGFAPISTNDVVSFYENGAPLPDRAVYIMFEGGRKDSAIYGQEALIQTGMRANMFVYTGLMSAWNRTFLKKGQVGTLYRSRFWDVGSNGGRPYLGGEAGGAEQSGGQGFYLADYARDASGRPTETPEQFAARAEEDFRSSFATLERLTGEAPRAYLFMPANSLDNSLPPELSAVNRRLIAQYYRIAFTREGMAYNGRATNPLDLTRIRIGKDTTPEQLIRHLEGWLPNDQPYAAATDPALARWHADTGSVLPAANGLELTGDIHHNAFAWLSGSDGWANASLAARVTPSAHGEAILYFRFAGRESFVRVVFQPGKAVVQERAAGHGLLTLAEADLVADGAFSVQARILNNRLWLTVNGEPLFAEPVPLSVVRAGRVALGVNPLAGPEGRAADEDSWNGVFADFSVRPLPDLWRALDLAAMTPATADESGDATALLIRVNGEIPNREQTIALLRAANAGLYRYAVLPAGSNSLELLERAPGGMPLRFGLGFWTGVVLRPAAADWRALAGTAASAREKGLQVAARVDAGQAAALSRLGESLPLDIVLLPPDDVDPLVVTSLKRQYPAVLFESAPGAYTRK